MMHHLCIHDRKRITDPTNTQGGPTVQSGSAKWLDRHSTYDETNARAQAEAELLALSPGTPTTVLDLCGLWGGPRAVKNVVGRVARTKEALKAMVRGLSRLSKLI